MKYKLVVESTVLTELYVNANTEKEALIITEKWLKEKAAIGSLDGDVLKVEQRSIVKCKPE